MTPFNIVLIQPEIPPNTGNIARLCAATDTRLHLVGPLGFELSDRTLKRAGLDYWKHVDWTYYENLEAFAPRLEGSSFYLIENPADKIYSDTAFAPGDFLIFGKETKGLPTSFLEENHSQAREIPMMNEGVRSLNLSSCAALVLYEALRQNDFLSQKSPK